MAKMNIVATENEASTNARDLGVTLDRFLMMSTYVSNLCKSASFALKNIGIISQYIDQSSTEKN